MRIVSLYNLTEYSILESTNRIFELVNIAKAVDTLLWELLILVWVGLLNLPSCIKSWIKPIWVWKFQLRKIIVTCFYAKIKKGIKSY